MRVIDEYITDRVALYNGDSAEVLPGLPDGSVDLSIFSPPFSSLYTYSPTERDLGNCASDEEFFAQFDFITCQLLRVMKPGRHVCVHVADLTTTKATHGVIGLKDFSGDVIRHFQKHGFILHGKVTVDKCPQAQAIRTKAKGLLFVQLEKDSLWSRPALPDYLLVFRTPGESAVPVVPEVTRDEWIEWARPVWYNIKETDTLNAALARENQDERHICPLQRQFIRQCIKLWSNRGEVVLSPFAGIGSEGYVAIQEGRRFIGVELKPAYFRVAVDNLKSAERGDGQNSLLDELDEIEEPEPTPKKVLPDISDSPEPDTTNTNGVLYDSVGGYDTGKANGMLAFAKAVKAAGRNADILDEKGVLSPALCARLANKILRGVASDRPEVTSERWQMATNYVPRFFSFTENQDVKAWMGAEMEGVE